jgi:hypothetical protein
VRRTSHRPAIALSEEGHVVGTVVNIIFTTDADADVAVPVVAVKETQDATIGTVVATVGVGVAALMTEAITARRARRGTYGSRAGRVFVEKLAARAHSVCWLNEGRRIFFRRTTAGEQDANHRSCGEEPK